MISLAVWVASTSVRIEWWNAQAGIYLPRHDEEAGTKRRVSFRQIIPRDELRELVSTVGLMQYLFAPLVVGFAAFYLSRDASAQRPWFAACAGVAGFAALSLAVYRGYYTSLGL
jgi:hypothetical protein